MKAYHHQMPYGAMILLLRETGLPWVIALVYNSEYKNNTVYYASPYRPTVPLAEQIEQVAKGADKYSASELDQYFFTLNAASAQCP